MSNVIASEPCPDCGSRDNLKRYDDGHAFCFGMGCGRYEPGEGQSPPTTEKRLSGDMIAVGEAIALTARKLTEETCRLWGYTVSEIGDKKVQLANYRDTTGRIVGQKVRFADKTFAFRGDIKDAGLYGQHLWRDGGRRVVITEGEIDAMSVSQAQGNKWPVVSIPNGCQGAAKALSRQMPWLLGFEEVVLMFDNDQPGQEAVAECAALFPPGRCKIAKLPLKDANDMLKLGNERGIVDAIFGAKTFRPDGIVRISDVRAAVLVPPEQGYPWYFDGLTKLTYGRHLTKIYTFGAGTGTGKTDLLTEQIAYDINTLDQLVGLFILEQPPQESVKRIAGKTANKRFHVPDGSWTQDELIETLDAMEKRDKLLLYDSFGATDWEVIKNTIRFLKQAEGVVLFYIDHITALAAAEDDERVALERIMAEMASLCMELGIIIHLVSHLATPDGKPHEEGGRVMARHFKGSRAIGFWSAFMFGLERDQQAENLDLRRTTTFRVLKDRFTGQATGQCLYLQYEADRGRLLEVDGLPDTNQKEAHDHFGDEVPF